MPGKPARRHAVRDRHRRYSGAMPRTAIIFLLLSLAGRARLGQSVAGRDLAQRSSGVARGEAWVLTDDGFAGSYITLPRAGMVSVTVHASGIADGGEAPRMNLVVGDD